MITSEITLPLVATSAEHAPKSSLIKKKQLIKKKSYKTLKRRRKSVLGFLHSVNHTGSPQDKSYIHSYFIPGQNNKSSKGKFKKSFKIKFK